MNRIAEATAVRHGVRHYGVERDRRHRHHKEEGESGAELAIDPHQEEGSEEELSPAEHEGQSQGEELSLRSVRIEDGSEVLPDLQCRPHRVYSLQKSREDEDHTHEDAGTLGEGMTWMNHASGLLSLIRQKRA